MIMKWLHDDNEPTSLLLQTCKQKKQPFFLFLNTYMRMHKWIHASLSCLLQCFKSSPNLMDRCISKFWRCSFTFFLTGKLPFQLLHITLFFLLCFNFFFFFFLEGGGTGRRKCSEKFYNFSVSCQLNRTGNIHLLQLPFVPEFQINVNVFSHYLQWL